ncbi:unnamed protein product [Mytilus edulis]|uniref:Uncharacterized protein n=1 Tax=Mytilus edulis TaxID=6550 RepID=A0A8S3PSM2_MYTED|nr:unnamed protein product [Mytilus edulis]
MTNSEVWKTCLKPRKELEEVLERINKSTEIKDAHIELSSLSRADDLVKFHEENFIPDDTLCTSIGVVYDEDARQFLLAFLADNLSVIIVDNRTNEIIASLGLVLEYDGMPNVKLANKKLGLAAGYLNYKQEDMNVYKRFKCNKSVNLAFLCTHRQHRGKRTSNYCI